MNIPVKYKIHILVFLSIVLLTHTHISAQTNFSDTLEQVIVTDSQLKKIYPKEMFQALEPGKKIDARMQKLFQSQSLDALLQSQTNVFIKNYGVNSLSTLSVRGTSAAQSQVLWNQIPLNNAATGYSDLSLLTTGFFDEVQLQYSGSSSLYGNGNIGGTVLLKSFPFPYNFLNASLSYGSFENYKALVKTGISKKQHRLQVRMAGLKGKNNFGYTDGYGRQKVLSNAEQEQAGVLLDYQTHVPVFSSEKPLYIDVHTWYQYDYRAIPSSWYESQSVKNQTDKNWRNSISLRQDVGRKWSTYLHLGYQNEDYQYQDSLAIQNQKYHLQNTYLEWGWHLKEDIKTGHLSHNLLVFTPFQLDHLLAAGQQNKISRNRRGIAAAYQLKWKEEWALQLKARQEWQAQKDIPLTYGLLISNQSLKYSLSQLDISGPIYFSVQNGYRLPTLNELYFFPGGNPNLQAESSLNLEAGWSVHLNSKTHPFRNLTLKSGYFQRDVNNWIYWLGNSIWTPYNIAQVKSHGWDWQLKANYSLNDDWQLFHYTDYAYTIATTQASIIMGSNSIGKQIPYTPRYLLSSNLGFVWKNLFFNLNYQYTGYRFTQLDESEYLYPYSMFNIFAKYNFPILSSKILSVEFQLHNMSGTVYQSVKGRPMPPLQTLLTVSLSL